MIAVVRFPPSPSVEPLPGDRYIEFRPSTATSEPTRRAGADAHVYVQLEPGAIGAIDERALLRCYRNELRWRPALSGVLTARFEVRGGVAEDLRMAATAPAEGALSDCVAGGIRRARFDSPGAAILRARFFPEGTEAGDGDR